MSYTRFVNEVTIHITCAANPEYTYNTYYDEIEQMIYRDSYEPETDIDNLITMSILMFDCDDNYGEYDSESGSGGYGDSFSIEEYRRYVEESGGWKEFDYYA